LTEIIEETPPPPTRATPPPPKPRHAPQAMVQSLDPPELPRYKGGIPEYDRFDLQSFLTPTIIAWEKHITEVVNKMDHFETWQKFIRPGSVLLDIGANFGAFAALLANACPSCGIMAFEPVPKYAGFINYKYGWHPNLAVWPYGVADQEMTAELWMSTTNLGWNTLEADKRTPEMVKTTIRAKPLDMILSGANLDISFMKIDTEGSEWRKLFQI